MRQPGDTAPAAPETPARPDSAVALQPCRQQWLPGPRVQPCPPEPELPRWARAQSNARRSDGHSWLVGGLQTERIAAEATPPGLHTPGYRPLSVATGSPGGDPMTARERNRKSCIGKSAKGSVVIEGPKACGKSTARAPTRPRSWL